MAYDKPIIIQKKDETTEEWSDLYSLHARVNRGSSDNVKQEAGAIRNRRTLNFDVMFFHDISDIAYALESYRILYDGHYFDLTDYDDYMEKHISVRFTGVSYE